ncbi:MAG TPA: cupin domain-containing protein [Myxococcales bacterium]|nr:cupin domain-containing protein [Myxococcales bacterium]
MKAVFVAGLLLCASFALSVAVSADEVKAGAAKAHPIADHILAPAAMKWGPGPPSLPKGVEVAGLSGDMSKKGSEYTVRLRVPDGWKIGPHFHPGDEHVTVIQGAFWMATGDAFDDGSLKEMAVGAFHEIPKGVHHYGLAKGETIIQLHGVGPWGIAYVNPADDPAKAAASKP